MQSLSRMLRYGAAAVILTAMFGMLAVVSAGADNKKPAAPKAAPAAKPAATAHPSGGAGGASHGGAGASTSHGPSANGAASHGPTANGAASHGPTANGGGAHNATTTAGHPSTAAGNAHTPVAGGVHPTAGGGGVHNSSFKSPAPRGTNERVTRGGSAIRTRPGGRVADVHDARRGMDVHHGLAGGRRVSMERADHSRVFAERGRRGFVERPYRYHGRDFARRSYYYHGRAYERYYHGYYYRGVYVNVYAPAVYYGPGFYGWAYNPWAVPINYSWGWGGNPWYGYYGFYFAPYPVYPSAAFWLTDYIIAANLQAAYAAHQEAQEQAAAAAASGQPALTPDVKQMISDEVKAQLALENQEAAQNAQQQDVDPNSSGIARMLSDGHPHVFVAGGNLDVTDASSGQECALSDGDALQLQTPPASDATAANLVVLASKGGVECARSSTVTVQVADLQEMQNHMRETIDQGLQELQSKQGQGGLPAAPPSAKAPPAAAQYASAAPPAEQNLSQDITQADQQSDQAEKDVTTEAAQDNGGGAAVAATAAPAAPAAPTATVNLGQTTDQVQAAMGAPTRIANLGAKTIYYYNGMKVTFKDGKVSDVE
ncbi:MAG TPA: hypothetical protein VKR52_12215 [Terracidiphilus sp.]|nr:hypothetical protein [Terracidiphilus sp.]